MICMSMSVGVTHLREAYGKNSYKQGLEEWWSMCCSIDSYDYIHQVRVLHENVSQASVLVWTWHENTTNNNQKRVNILSFPVLRFVYIVYSGVISYTIAHVSSSCKLLIIQ